MPSKDVKKKKVVSGVKKVVASKKRPIKGAGFNDFLKKVGFKKQTFEEKKNLYEKHAEIMIKIGEGLDKMESFELFQKANNGELARNDWYSPRYATALKDIILGGNLLDLLRDYRKTAFKSFVYKINYMGEVDDMPLKTYDDVALLFRRLIKTRKQRWKRIEKKMAIRPPGPHGPPGPPGPHGRPVPYGPHGPPGQQGQSQQGNQQPFRNSPHTMQTQSPNNPFIMRQGMMSYGQPEHHTRPQPQDQAQYHAMSNAQNVGTSGPVLLMGGSARRKKRVTKLSGKKPKKPTKPTKKKSVSAKK